MIQEAKVYRVEHQGKTFQFLNREAAEIFVNKIIKDKEDFNNLVDFVRLWDFNSPEELSNIIVNNYKKLNPLVEACLY